MANELSGKEIAKSLRDAADRFEQSAETFDWNLMEALVYASSKAAFLNHVHALRSVSPSLRKQYLVDQINVIADFGAFRIRVFADRNRVCRLIKAAEYECEPLLSPEEDAELVSK